MNESSGTPTTKSPTCPPWCDDHIQREDDYAGEHLTFHSHSGSLYAADVSDGKAWTFWLRLTSTHIERDGVPRRVEEPPTLILAEYGSEYGGRRLDPAQARELAAALIRGAEVVEGSLTARCAGCGRAVVPDDAEACPHCQVRAERARRQSFTLVRGER